MDPVHWFLNDREDTRSSYYLEDAATEFQVQGLELDWTCVTWDGDLRFTDFGWSFHDFRGDRWSNIHNDDNRRYLRNAYRVLLTRARQGMVILVPSGDRTDPTRSPTFYDSTFKYLTELGIPEVAWACVTRTAHVRNTTGRRSCTQFRPFMVLRSRYLGSRHNDHLSNWSRCATSGFDSLRRDCSSVEQRTSAN